jgi:hypothetical protein
VEFIRGVGPMLLTAGEAKLYMPWLYGHRHEVTEARPISWWHFGQCRLRQEL